MRKIIITAIIFLLLTGTSLAHDGSEHISELERWIAGAGVLMICGTAIYTLLEKRHPQQEDPPSDTNV